MNIILFHQSEVKNDRVVVEERRADHIVKILGSDVGDSLRVGVIDGSMGTGKVLFIQRKHPRRVELSLNLDKKPGPKPIIDLLLAMPRPIMLKRILSQSAALGVDRIYLIHARRVEKSFWSGSILEEEQYTFQLIQGLEQAVDTRLPVVKINKRFKDFIEEVLPQIQGGYSHLLLAHPQAEKKLVEVMTSQPSKILLAVGPEGGWVKYELDMLERKGFVPFTVGRRILKVDTAVVALHSQITLTQDFLSRFAASQL